MRSATKRHLVDRLVVALICGMALGCGGHQAPVESRATVLEPPPGRLPDGIRPMRYELSLEVIPERETFAGLAVITLELAEPASQIWMHGRGLDVMSIHAEHAGTRVEASWEQRTSDGVALVELAEPLPAGPSMLHVRYTARLDAPLQGSYRVVSDGNAYAFTQFESISARAAFPCFDEPRFKTPFDITLTVPGDQLVASSTPVDRAVRLSSGLQRVAFVRTPPLPTYLVAWVVGPFDVVRGPDIPPVEGRPFAVPLRGIAAKGSGPRLRYALEHAGAFVEALERYFDIPYPYRKLDLVAVPDFAAGAMENVGLITFREWLLLLEADGATEGQRRAFAYVMAHELAHQWFGNLVTMPWWDDIWLNEAFATWMGDKIVASLYPEYRSSLSSLASAQRAMDLDSLQSARSIRQPIESNHDIKNAFDAITYQKGGAVLTMFEKWIGDETFQDAIRLYLRRHQWRTATSSDLLAALDEVSGRDVSGPFHSFLTQPGVPLVSVRDQDVACESGSRRLELRQQRYFPVGSSAEQAQTWQIPLCVRHAGGKTCGLLAEAEGHIDLPGCPRWWMPNDDGSGYFRFSLSPSAWASLEKEGLAKLSDLGTMAVADSVLGEFDRAVLGPDGLLSWFSAFVASPVRQVATAPMGPLAFMMYEAASPATQPRVQSYAHRLYRRRLSQLGWRGRRSDSSDVTLLREAVIRFVVMDVRDPEARARAARLGRAYAGYQTEKKPGIVEPQLAALVLSTAVQEGDEGLFDHLVDALVGSQDATTRNRILAALGAAEGSALSRRALDLSLDPRLRMNEVMTVLGPQFRNPRTREDAWRWLTEHFDALSARLGASQVGYTPWLASSFCSEEAATEVTRFFEPRVESLPGGPRNLAGAIEAITLCAHKARAHGPAVERTFAHR
jgi:alanyl aminopeptidase